MNNGHAPKTHSRLSAPQTILLSFAAMVCIGTLLLMLPIATKTGEGAGPIDALLTATSATCVTGLIVFNTAAHWSLFGQLVILLLIQLGGLGLMTVITIAMVLTHRRISLQERLVIQASFNQESTGGMVKLVRKIIFITLCIEGTAAVLLAGYFLITGGMPFGEALYKGIFHAISAFCNAGFDIIGTQSLTPYRGSILVNFVIMALIILGGLGFTVLLDMRRLVKDPYRRSLKIRIAHLSLHTKIALSVTCTLLFGGMLLFLLLEWNNPDTLGPLPFGEKLLAAAFQSVTLRTAGFNTIDQNALEDISKVLSSVMMFIGGSPAGTAGGIKTVTLGVMLAAMLSALRGSDKAEAFGRTLPLDMLQKALTVTCAMLIIVVGSTLILHFSEQGSGYGFLDILFEVTSGAGTVGVTAGLTPRLSVVGKLVITLCMFTGRLGPVTIVMALNRRLRESADSFTYPDERVIIG